VRKSALCKDLKRAQLRATLRDQGKKEERKPGVLRGGGKDRSLSNTKADPWGKKTHFSKGKDRLSPPLPKELRYKGVEYRLKKVKKRDFLRGLSADVKFLTKLISSRRSKTRGKKTLLYHETRR